MTASLTRRPASDSSIPVRRSPGGVQDSQQAEGVTAPMNGSPAGASSRPTIENSTANLSTSGGDQPADRHIEHVAHGGSAVGSNSRPGRSAIRGALPNVITLTDPALALAAAIVDDLEKVRTANANRLDALTRDKEDSDGEIRGFGLNQSHPDVARLAAMVAAMEKVEHDAVLNLQRKMRAHPLGPWAKAQKGVGEKQAARLLAAIGDPYIRPEIIKADGTVLPEGPRTVSALWAYCGLHVVSGAVQQPVDTPPPLDSTGANPGGDLGHPSVDTRFTAAGVAPRRARGQRANWSSDAKTRAYLISLSCLKQNAGVRAGTCGEPDAIKHTDGCACSPYRVVYDRRRAHTALTRPDWTDGHRHNDALRVASKAILRDLWREAKRLHTGTTD